MTDIVRLAPPPPEEPQETCISILERMLARARTGEIISVFCVGTTRRKGAVTAWAHPDTVSGDRHAMLGAIELGKHDFMMEAFEHD